MRRERGAARCHAIQRSKTHTRCTQTAHHYRCKKPTPLARARHGVTRERAPPSSPKEHWLLRAGSKAAEKPLETETVAPLRRHLVLADEDAPLRPAWSGGAVGSKISLEALGRRCLVSPIIRSFVRSFGARTAHGPCAALTTRFGHLQVPRSTPTRTTARGTATRAPSSARPSP